MKNIAFIFAAAFIGGVIGYTFGSTAAPAPQAHMMDAMHGMTMELEGKTGDEFDKAFLEGMIVHHEGAVAMAEALLANTQRPELVQLGDDIVTAQSREIEMMRGWLRDWYGE